MNTKKPYRFTKREAGFYDVLQDGEAIGHVRLTDYLSGPTGSGSHWQPAARRRYWMPTAFFRLVGGRRRYPKCRTRAEAAEWLVDEYQRATDPAGCPCDRR